MKKRRSSKIIQAKVALCYIRQSVTRDENDTGSPERQRANITAVCEKNGWLPEWYEDAEGHRSGRDIKNRPGWLALSSRIEDPDVVALVANDLARLHRKGWRVGDMIEHLEHNGVALVLAAPGREVDTSTPQGKMFIQFTAMLDEYYAEDISQRAKDSVAYRKSLGMHVGQALYGTIKNKGYLVPSPEGAWLMPDGQYQAGNQDECPHPQAVWKSYYEGARLILEYYAQGNIGLEHISYRMNDEGFPFRGRRNTPRSMTENDIRCVVSGWPKYGGIVTFERSRDRRAYEEGDIEGIVFDEERAVFPIELLRRVAEVRNQRSVKPLDGGKPSKAKFYPLSQIMYCAHCEALVNRYGDNGYRTTLTGTHLNGNPKYRHKPGVKCGCRSRSVPTEVVEEDFSRLMDLLFVNPDMLEVMSVLSLKFNQAFHKDNVDPDQEKQENIALCKRRIAAAVTLYGDGMIDRDEYVRRKEKNEREIAHWQAKTTETEKVALELSMSLEAIETAHQ